MLEAISHFSRNIFQHRRGRDLGLSFGTSEATEAKLDAINSAWMRAWSGVKEDLKDFPFHP